MNYPHSNTVIITLVTAFVLLTIYFIFKKDLEPDQEQGQEDIYSIPYLKKSIRMLFNEITNQNIAEL
ncbi:MAG: hypothetical protein GX359_04440, partial [Clostridiales bacterium]|nr:hypothetical protein [Clostridiales bacterium]